MSARLRRPGPLHPRARAPHSDEARRRVQAAVTGDYAMDVNRLIDGFLGGGQRGAGTAGGGAAGGGLADAAGKALGSFPGGLAGGAAAGGLVALMLGNKKARKVGGKVLTYGGLAAAAGLAYKAYRNYQAGAPTQPAGQTTAQTAAQAAGQTPAPHAIPAPPADSGFDPAQASDAQGGDLRLLLIRAMISAAKADGHIDAAEHARIQEQIGSADLAADEKAFLFDQLSAPADPIAVASLARDEAQASELYLVSLLAIDVDTAEERRYLERLGDALRLPEALRGALESEAGAARAQLAAER